MSLVVRLRSRRGYSKEAQGYIGWDEWQLVDGRKILGRYDFEEDAIKARRARELAKRSVATESTSRNR